MKHKHSLVLGKFLDFHVGHEMLIRHAISLADQTTVLLCIAEGDRVPFTDRHQWITNTFGKSIELILVDQAREGLEAKEESDRDVSASWATWVLSKLPSVDLLVGSEDYVQFMGEAGNLYYAIYDKERTITPCSSTSVNSGDYKYRAHTAKSTLATKVYFVGPESTGKSIATKMLSGRLGCEYVSESARDFLSDDGTFSLDDLPIFALAHELAVRVAVRDATSTIFLVDSSVVTTIAYSEEQFGLRDSILQDLLNDENGLYLVFTPEVPWINDGTRLMESIKDREDFFDHTIELLEDYGKRFTIINGDNYFERLDKASEGIKGITNV